MQLINQWKQVFKFSSTWLHSTAAIFYTYITLEPNAIRDLWTTLPIDIKSTISPTIIQAVGVLIIISGIIARIVKQKSIKTGVGS